MRGLVFPGDGTVGFKDLPVPIADVSEVVVQVRASGMCGSDLHFLNGKFDFDHSMIQGHEPCGVIYEVGPGVPPEVAAVGDRVLVHHYWGCGFCRRCREGWPQMCEASGAKAMAVDAHGGHAPFVAVPASTLNPLPDEMSFRAGAALSCGTGTAWGAIKRIGGVSDTTTVVIGQGPIGQSVVMLASSMGARVVAVDVNSNRLQLAENLGADIVVNSRDEDLAGIVGRLTNGRMAEVVVETSGRASSDALSILGTFGRAVFTGLPGETTLNIQEVYKRQWTFMTSWTMSWIEQRRCAEFIVEHRLPIDELFSHSWTLDQAQEAYEWFSKQDAGKGVFEFDNHSDRAGRLERV